MTSSKYIQFDFGEPRYITEWRMTRERAFSFGTWQAQVSSNGSDWINVGSSQTVSATTTTYVDFSANNDFYRYYRILGVSGSISQTWTYEMEFKIDDNS